MAKKAESKSNKEVQKKEKKVTKPKSKAKAESKSKAESKAKFESKAKSGSKAKIKNASAPKTAKGKKKLKSKKNKSFFTDLLENVEYGAKIVGEKTSNLATETYEKVKKGAIEAIDTSSQVVGDLYYSASDYTEQFKDKIEMKKLNSVKEDYFADLGRIFYKKYKIEKMAFSKFSKTKDFTSIMKNIEELDQEIVLLGEHFKQ